jgi:hypothetical protein
MGKVYRHGKVAVKRNRVIAEKITIPDPFSSPEAIRIAADNTIYALVTTIEMRPSSYS